MQNEQNILCCSNVQDCWKFGHCCKCALSILTRNEDRSLKECRLFYFYCFLLSDIPVQQFNNKDRLAPRQWISCDHFLSYVQGQLQILPDQATDAAEAGFTWTDAAIVSDWKSCTVHNNFLTQTDTHKHTRTTHMRTGDIASYMPGMFPC